MFCWNHYYCKLSYAKNIIITKLGPEVLIMSTLDYRHIRCKAKQFGVMTYGAKQC